MGRADSIILNDYKSKKGLANGKKIGIEITADRIVHEFDPMKLAKGPSEAMAAAVAEAIQHITKPPSAGSIARRQRAGILSRKMFVATGKLVRGLTVVESGDGYETRAPRGRLSGETAGLVKRLFEVAKLSAKELMSSKKVQTEVRGSVKTMISVEKGR